MATSSSNTTFTCPPPFLSQANFPSKGGYIGGRLCYPLLDTSCCVPCPLTDWAFSHAFRHRVVVGNWVNVAALFATVFLLLSFACLDKKWTNRHYLSVCLATGVLFIELGFIIPLITKPPECHDAITPNDMLSNTTCGFSGAFVYFGAWSAVVWIFWRALSIHLQICWDVTPARKFFYSAMIIGWGIACLGVALVLSLPGVSYRFANTCHINHKYGLGVFWIPLLILAAVALVLQFATICYCANVFLKNMLREFASNNPDNESPSVIGSLGSIQTYRRVKRLVQLQWKGASIVMVILAEVTFFSVVFVSMDKNTNIRPGTPEALEALQWATCLIQNNGDSDKCLNFARKLVISESTLLAVLVFIGLSGFWCLLFLGKRSMVLGWRDLIRRKVLRREEHSESDSRPDSALSGDERAYKVHDSKRSSAAADMQARGHASMPPGMVRNVFLMPPEAKAANGDDIEYRSSTGVDVASSMISSPVSSTPRASLQPHGVQHSRLSSSTGHEMAVTALPQFYSR